jgi:hypothetical protein
MGFEKLAGSVLLRKTWIGQIYGLLVIELAGSFILVN